MKVTANGITIEIDEQGPPDGEPLLLIMGLGMQLIGWPPLLVQDLALRGFRVVRLDNRDAGLSQGYDHLGVPNLPWSALRATLGMSVRSPYRVGDMAADAVGVLDALGIARAHVCGASMGGMISQHIAANHPDRVKSLTLIMTTTGARQLPQPSLHVRRALLDRPASGSDPEVIVAHLEKLLRLIGSPAYPPDPEVLRAKLRMTVQRAWRPQGTARQLLAVMADGDRTDMVRRIAAPTCIIHGEADPLIPVGAGRDLMGRIAGAVADFIPGMGHDLPETLLPRIAERIAANAARATVPAAPPYTVVPATAATAATATPAAAPAADPAGRLAEGRLAGQPGAQPAG